jgi:hypothetical protein
LRDHEIEVALFDKNGDVLEVLKVEMKKEEPIQKVMADPKKLQEACGALANYNDMSFIQTQFEPQDIDFFLGIFYNGGGSFETDTLNALVLWNSLYK